MSEHLTETILLPRTKCCGVMGVFREGSDWSTPLYLCPRCGGTWIVADIEWVALRVGVEVDAQTADGVD